MAWLGAVYLLILAGVVFGIPAYIGYRRRPVVLRNQRKRQIEQAMYQYELDQSLIDEVAQQWGHGPRRHYRRR